MQKISFQRIENIDEIVKRSDEIIIARGNIELCLRCIRFLQFGK